MHLLPEEELRQARTALHNHRVAEQSALEQKKTAESELAQLRAQALTDKSADECNSDLASVNEAGEELNRGMGSALAQLQADDSRRTLLADQMRELEAAKRECGHWEKLNALIGSSDGKKFRSYVQSLTLEQLVILANSALHDFSSRYILVRSTEEKTPLAIDVIDNDLSGARRSAKNLSGGETFIVSLSLALGLSRLASRNITIESLFLDEGFGSLDEDSLEKAIETLAKLVDGRHLVGLISHVGKIEERIAARIEVKKQPGGVSTLSGPGVSHRS
jgi:exonuclease SbcC